jgi:branched-chain amino acid transport system substrate-binding protein
MTKTIRAGVTRRQTLAAAGLGLGGLALSGRAYGQTMAAASPAQTLKVGFFSPRSGPLASFGEADPFVINLVRQKYATGLNIGGTMYDVAILDRDTQSDPARASQLAKDLINNENVDMILATSTPEVVNPVADAAEANGVPCLSTIVPWESWYFGRGAKPGAPSPFKWTYHFCFGVADFAKCYISTWTGAVPNNKTVGVLLPNDADGMAIRAHLYPVMKNAGFTIIDPGPYEDGTTDFSDQIAAFKSGNIEIFNTFPFPPDFASFWRQAAQQGLTRRIKIAEVAKTGVFPSSIEALGPLGYKICSAAYWHRTFPYASPITGLSSAALASGYQTGTGKQWHQQLGATMALFDAGFAALGKASQPKDKAALAKSLSTLNVTTTMGKVDFTSGPVPNISTTPLFTAQWLKATTGPYKLKYVLNENAANPAIPVQAPLIPYNV